MRLLPVFSLFLVTLALPARSADVIAKVGTSEITAADLQPYLKNLDPEQAAALAKDPAALNQFLRTLIVQRLLLKQATAAKFEQQPDVAARLARLRDAAVAEAYLAAQAKVPAGFPSAAELQAAYDANKAALLVPRQYRLAQIFIAAPKEGAPAPAKLAAVQDALKAPKADFAKLAEVNSDEATSAAQGGEIGWLSEAQIQPEIRATVTSLSPGGVSAPVRLADGWHILKLLEVKDAYTPELSEVRDLLVQRLRAAKARQESEAYVAQLLQDNPVAINEIAVSQLLERRNP